MATMLDVANRAGVSLSTVSYAISGVRPVSEKTRVRIQKAMDDLGFRPNAMARGLASRKSLTVALTFPAVENGFDGTAMEFVASAAATARRRGYHLVLWPFLEEEADEIADLALQGFCDGVIVMEVRLEDRRVEALASAGLAFAMIGRTAHPEAGTYLDIDFDACAEDAVAYLEGLGHTRIALLNHSEAAVAAGYGPAVRIASAFRAAMRSRGLEPVDVCSDENPVAGRRAVAGLLDAHPDLTALVAMNEDAMYGATAELTARGLVVPRDFSVLSIVSSPGVSARFSPTLTTMNAPGRELGRLAVEALLGRFEQDAPQVASTLLPCSPPVGSTTAPAPGQLVTSRAGASERPTRAT
jgi:DNA-binding LacI/PurR family transcriptional regulator